MDSDLLKLLPAMFGKVRPQDIFVAVIFLVAVVVFRAPDVWELQPSWQLDISSEEGGRNQKDLLPLPIVADLDSDGINELIITTGDSRLKILTLPPQESIEDASALPHLHVKTEIEFKTNSSKPAFPVAFTVGCTKKDGSALNVCHQIVVAVTNDGVVHCFTDKLQLLWATPVLANKKNSDSNFYYKEITVQVVPHLADYGMVLVGGTVTEAKQAEPQLEHDHKYNFTASLSAEEIAKQPPRRQRNTKMVTEDQDHFSSYALNSKTGNVLWKHERGDYEAKKLSKEDLLSAYHFKLALHSSQYHVGEVHWSLYTESLLTSLPYRWQHPRDTNIHTAVFTKRKPTTRDQKRNGDFKTEVKVTANRTKPNAAVIYRRKAIEVLSLESGHPLCTYTVSKDGTTIGDVNGDGVIDQVTTYFTSERLVQSDIHPCSAVVTAGAKTLFTGSICRPISAFGGYFDSVSEEDYRHEPLPVAPLLVRSPRGRKGIFSHLSGSSFRREGIRTFDSIFLIGTGRLTSFGPYGEFNWQVDTPAFWTTPVESNTKVEFVPNIQATSTTASNTRDAVLVAGWTTVALVSLADGTLLASHSLPCQPLSPVVHGDFTNDGLVDFVVHCKKRFLGFSLDRRPGYWWTAVWIACGLGIVIIAVLVLHFIEEIII